MPSIAISAISVLSLAVNALAAAVPSVIGEPLATRAPAATDTPIKIRDLTAAPEYVTINIINSYGSPLSTIHASDPAAPAPVSGNVNPDTIAAGATAAFAVPTGWTGNVALVDSTKTIEGDDTLIEGSFIYDDGYSFAVMDVDVSYVNGFSVPVTCSCSGSGVVTGCNRDLFSLNQCDNVNDQGSCVNPLRSSTEATSASTFFAPCQYAAWTYVNDGEADAWSLCQSGQVTCCVGTSCEANPKQPS